MLTFTQDSYVRMRHHIWHGVWRDVCVDLDQLISREIHKKRHSFDNEVTLADNAIALVLVIEVELCEILCVE